MKNGLKKTTPRLVRSKKRNKEMVSKSLMKFIKLDINILPSIPVGNRGLIY